jgi:hypothetical protein
MKPHATTRDPSEKEGSSPSQPRPARRESLGVKESQYDLRVSYYATMKPQRVYPLVVEVSRGSGAAPADGPTGTTVTLRPVVPGALVAPAELPLEVSRPGARATFHVTPVARGRLPEACVRVFHDGRPVQELRTRMTAKTQRTTWVLLLLALILPPLLAHWAITDPLKGRVPIVTRKALREEARAKEAAEKAKDAEADKAAGPAKGGGGVPPPLPPPPPLDQKSDPYQGLRPGKPGEVLEYRVDRTLRAALPNFPYSDELIDGIAIGVGFPYDTLCDWAQDVYLPCWLAVGLLILTFGSWAMHKPTRVHTRGSVALPRLAGAGARYAAETGETLPLARPQGDDLG